MRTLDKKPNGVAPKPVSGYVSGVTEYLDDDAGSSATSFNIATAAAGSAWESVGPTGSGATHIWTALDSMPSGAKWVEIKIINIDIGLWARVTGSALGLSDRVKIAFSTTNLETAIKIPVDSIGRFDLYASSGAGTTTTLWLNGWGI